MSTDKPHKKISSARLIALGFAGLILLGTILLMLPISTQDRQGASFVDAIFTSTSCVCVTGLVVQDTATYWSVFGKMVIISLIQIGGMGVVTFALTIAIKSGKRLGLRQRSILQSSVSAHNVGGIVRLTKFIIKGTALIEVLGALIFAPAFIKNFGFEKGVLYSIFHSVSAFCNAGFDLMGTREKFSSFTSEATNPFINIAVILLITLGSLGFLTWHDIKTHKFKFKKYSLQSKICVTMALLLLFIPAVIFFFFEFYDYPLKDRIWLSLFQSVTTRTAGFNTANLAEMSEGSLALMILLMLTGGSPGSTAGGIKTTTIAVLIATASSAFIKGNSPHFFGRRVGYDTIKKAVSIFTMYVILLFSSTIIISWIEDIPVLTSMFECASAIATVGLTLGITPTLTLASRAILVVLMFFGRVGGLTLVFAAVNNTKSSLSKYPKEDLTIG